MLVMMILACNAAYLSSSKMLGLVFFKNSRQPWSTPKSRGGKALQYFGKACVQFPIKKIYSFFTTWGEDFIQFFIQVVYIIVVRQSEGIPVQILSIALSLFGMIKSIITFFLTGNGNEEKQDFYSTGVFDYAAIRRYDLTYMDNCT